MTNWLEKNRKIVLIIILVLFVILAVLYLFIVRPLAAEEMNQQQQLDRINNDVSFYQEAMNKLSAQQFKAFEKQKLLASVPLKPNVEQAIADLERTELETGAVIESIGFSIHPNETNSNDQQNGQQQANKWNHILPEDTLAILKKKVENLDALTVSYIEMAVSINGKIDDVHKFVNQLEHLKRTMHVQSYDYSINEEKDNRLEGTVIVRAFYCEDFAKIIKADPDFNLDYEFDPKKIKRYVEPASISDGGSVDNSFINFGTENEVGESVEKAPSVGDSSRFELYYAPKNNNVAIKEGEPLIQIVQSGAYTTENYLYLAAENLINEGLYPRIIGDDISYIYTAADSNESSAQKIVDHLKSKGFKAYLKKMPYRLTEVEKEILLAEAHDTVTTMTGVMTKALTEKDFIFTKEQLNTVHSKISAYEKKVQQVLTKSISKERRQELEETVAILKQIEMILIEYGKTGDRSIIWESEGLVLDYLLNLNGYEHADLKGF